MGLSALLLLPPIFPATKHSFSTTNSAPHLHLTPKPTSLNPNSRPFLVPTLLSIALTVTLNLPLPSLAIPSINGLSSNKQSLLSPTTPFSQSRNLQIGLDNGKIRPCPPTNPGCISTNPKSASFAFPLTIPETSRENAIQKLQEVIMQTQKNAKIKVVEDTPNGSYLQAEVEGGGFGGLDVVEFLVRGDVASYRCMAKKVTYIYPFTTAFGDSKGQEERMKKIIDELGWYSPSFDAMD